MGVEQDLPMRLARKQSTSFPNSVTGISKGARTVAARSKRAELRFLRVPPNGFSFVVAQSGRAARQPVVDISSRMCSSTVAR
jgi:hypothetical protein